jgi:hypothetical protein
MLASAGALAQPTAPDALQQRFAALRQSMAQNQAKLRLYTWTETTELTVNGELRKRSQNVCRYTPDGRLIKTPIGESAPAAPKRGVRGKIVANKSAEMKEYLDRVESLLQRYSPPDPQMMEMSFQAGKAAVDAASGGLAFADYAKPGDRVTLTFDPAAGKIRSFNVTTYLDGPNDLVTLNARFATLADGTSYLDESLLNATAKDVRIRTINFGHQKVGN